MSNHLNFKFKVPIDSALIQDKVEELLTDDVRLELNNLVAKTIDPWVPFLEGPLSQTLEITPEHLKYLVPYAHYQYYGDGFNHTKDYHPLATERWLDVAMQTQYEVFIAHAREILARKAREVNG